jgi:HEPN domain-containing protein
MTEPPENVAEAKRWLHEAAEELQVANVLASDERLPARAVCFHAHLAAEKAMKALLIVRGTVLKHSHDLASLDPWMIEGRYPADLADSAPAEVRDLVAAARRVVDIVEQSADVD